MLLAMPGLTLMTDANNGKGAGDKGAEDAGDE